LDWGIMKLVRARWRRRLARREGMGRGLGGQIWSGAGRFAMSVCVFELCVKKPVLIGVRFAGPGWLANGRPDQREGA